MHMVCDLPINTEHAVVMMSNFCAWEEPSSVCNTCSTSVQGGGEKLFNIIHFISTKILNYLCSLLLSLSYPQAMQKLQVMNCLKYKTVKLSVVLSVGSSACDLWHELGRFAAKCEAAGVKSAPLCIKPRFFAKKTMESLPPLGCGELLPHLKEIKHLGVSFARDTTMGDEMGRQFGAASVVLQASYWNVVVKKAEPEDKGLDLVADLHFNPQLQP